MTDRRIEVITSVERWRRWSTAAKQEPHLRSSAPNCHSIGLFASVFLNNSLNRRVIKQILKGRRNFARKPVVCLHAILLA